MSEFLRKGEGKRLCSPEALKTTAFQFIYWFFALMYLELMLHWSVYGSFDWKIVYIAGFSASVACVLALVASFLPRTVQFVYALLMTAVLTVLYGSQMVYELIFGTLFSVTQTKLGGAAVTSFWKETYATMLENIVPIGLLLVPLVVLILARVFGKKLFARTDLVCRIALVIVAVLATVLTVQLLDNGGTGYFTDYYFYYAKDATTTQTVQRFGLITTFRLELVGEGKDSSEFLAETEPATVPETIEDEETVPGETEAETIPVEYNVLEIDFDALNELTEDETIRAINDYCSTLTGTNKNEYTGMLKDYNLILLCGESFSTGAIHPELTPTLYKLANEGIIFNNYYNSYPSGTSDGEYGLLVGLYPDNSRASNASSFYASRNSYLPFTFSMAVKEQLGLEPYGHHNYTQAYYGRKETHSNIGYNMKFSMVGMTFTALWPASDLEMMEQSVDDFIDDERFHAYYMTFSGHYKYDYEINPMAKRNWKYVKDLSEYSYRTKCYLSCNIELEKAMAYLMQRLEEEGIADKTAIVLAGDHFPYGLNDEEYSELVGYTIDDFSKYKSTLIFWVGGLEENIVVDEYCCNVDILPTLLNLWGLEYDSRLLAGTDVFSDGEHIAIRTDKSFYTDKLWLSSNTGEIKYLVDESEIPAGYVDKMIRLVQNKMDMSVNILNTAYYNFLFGKEEVEVNRYKWKN